MRVKARPMGWDEVLPPDSDLDPYDGPTDEIEGELEVHDVPPNPGCPEGLTLYHVSGHSVDPKTIRVIDNPSPIE